MKREHGMSAIMRVQAYLDRFGLGLKILELDDSTKTVALAAAALGVEEGQIAKTVTFLADTGPVLVVTAGDVKVSQGKLKRECGVRKVRLADPETVARCTGYEPGGICPLDLPLPVPVLLDESLRRFDTVYLAAGTANSALPLTMDQLEIVSGGRWAELS